jgi:hypothetical protein
MTRTTTRTARIHRLGLAAVAAAVAFTFTVAAPAVAQQAFKTPEAAADALAAAAKAGDRKDILAVLGSKAADIVSSGDRVADKNNRDKFVASFDAKHQITMEGDSKAIMVIGQDDWPFPIPLARAKGEWRFDAAAGREEILFRRIGRNELDTIQTCLAYVDAQDDYADMMRKDDVAPYAQRFVSSPGKMDGLYWPAKEGEPQSPIGEFAARASNEGYALDGGGEPYHGYYFRILKRQGPAAAGGAHNYVVEGKMIGGFALVAYPAAYANSGVMTFIVNQDGVVFQKDLGRNTGKIARKITSFDPDKSWTKVEPPQAAK